MLQLLTTFYPTEKNTCFDSLFYNSEFLVISLTFRAYKTTDEKDILCRLLGIFFAVITQIHKNHGSFALALSTSVSSLVIILCIVINLLIDFLDSKGISTIVAQEHLRY